MPKPSRLYNVDSIASIQKSGYTNAMKVIFIKDVGGVATRGTVKEITDGYALNYLIPNGLAKQATSDAVKSHSKEAAEKKIQSEKETGEIIAKIKKLEGTRVTIEGKANDKGHLFKGVGVKDIAKKMGIGESYIHGVAGAIKAVGDHKIYIEGAGAKATVILEIKAS